MADGERYWAVVKPVWGTISTYDGPRAFVGQFADLPPTVGHLLAAHWCQSEVRNGGQHQFFSNSTGVLAPEALVGFRAIGLTEWADVLAEAMRFFGDPYPRQRAERRAILSDRVGGKREDSSPFDALDERFDAWLNAEPRGRWERAADQYAVEQNL